MESTIDNQVIEDTSNNQTKHQIPKCLSCGTVNEWKVESLFLPRHFIIALVFLLAGGVGVIYLIAVGIARRDKNRRAKICPKCGARNLWTFIY